MIKKAFVDSLGCPKALVDGEKMSGLLKNHGLELAFTPEEADVIIVNTCGFILPAKEESVSAILSYAEMKKERNFRLIVTGCLTERYGKEISGEIPEIDAIIGVRDLSKILDSLETDSTNLLDDGEYREATAETPRALNFSGLHYAYLKISEGCDRVCAFCAIPSIRGNYRDRDEDDILKEAKILENQGIRELILIGEDLTRYGSTSGSNLVALLKRIFSETSFPRVRLLYLFPSEILIELARLMREEPRLCRYVDIPLQHASEKILSAMKRPGNANEYLDLFSRMREICPQIAIRSAFIIGFPAETNEDIKILSRFLSEARMNRVGFFEYSDEEGTSAFSMKKKVRNKTAKKRIAALAQIQEKISEEKLSEYVGKSLTVLFDGIIEDGFLICRTEFDAPEIDGKVFVQMTDESQKARDFLNVTITSALGAHDLKGEINEI